jgi:hypothetical protein
MHILNLSSCRHIAFNTLVVFEGWAYIPSLALLLDKPKRLVGRALTEQELEYRVV